MNKNQEELERIIEEFEYDIVHFIDSKIDNEEIFKKYDGEIDYLWKALAQAILSAGYVKLSDVELDEFKIAQILAKKEYCGDKCAEAAHAIAQAKDEIVKVKEEKLKPLSDKHYHREPDIKEYGQCYYCGTKIAVEELIKYKGVLICKECER